MGVRMRGVEVFRAGRYPVLDHKTKQRTHRTFTTRDLDDMAANFERFNLVFKPAMVKGHVPGSVYDPGIPRHGTSSRVYRDGVTLKIDADDVDPNLAAEIKAKKFTDVSAEIYEDPAEAGLEGGRGMMLRRIAVLGGDVPKVKGLNADGLERTLCFSESNVGLTVYGFSEGIDMAMGRDDMIQKLLGMAQEVLDTLDDVQLQDVCSTFCGGSTDSNAPAPAPVPVPDAKADDAPPMTFSEDQVKVIVERIAAPIQHRLSEVDRETKRARVHLFCENELAAGRIDPAEMDPTGGPTLADRLLMLDDSAKVFKFSEGGQDRELSQLDAEMRSIRNRTPKYARNGSRIAAGDRATSPRGVANGAESDEARVMRFAEEHADEIAKIKGEKPEDFVATFKTASPEQKRVILSGLAESGY